MVFFLLYYGDYSWNNEIQLPPTHSTKVLGLAVEMILGKWSWFLYNKCQWHRKCLVRIWCILNHPDQFCQRTRWQCIVWNNETTKKECCFCLVMGQWCEHRIWILDLKGGARFLFFVLVSHHFGPYSVLDSKSFSFSNTRKYDPKKC